MGLCTPFGDNLVGNLLEEDGVDQRAEPPSWLPDGAQPKTGTGADVRSPEADEAGEAARDGATEYSFDGESSYSNGTTDYSGDTGGTSEFGQGGAVVSGYSYEDKPSGEATSQVPPLPAEPSEPAVGNDFSGNDYAASGADESASRTSTFSAVSPRRYLAGGAATLTGAGKAAKAKSAKSGKVASPASARRADLVVARLEPWSVMKFSFLMSLVAWVVLFVAVAFLYFTLSSLGVFTSLQHTLSSVTSSSNSSGMNLNHWFSASRILGYTMLLGAVNIVLITALCTVGSMIYNLVTHLGGGIEVTLRETD
jgi:Transmembrane domain of unknown function (DUF3566)